MLIMSESSTNSNKWKLESGRPYPLGATVTPKGVNFSVFSKNATSVVLVLFEKSKAEPIAEIPIPPETNRTGDLWHIHLAGIDRSLGYAYRAFGPFDQGGTGDRFDERNILLDPYARALDGGGIWGQEQAGDAVQLRRRCCIVEDSFDWEGDRPLNIPLKESVIYELHVRGYTVHESSGVAHRGTYRGLIEKIPYIQSLGVTAVELMPVFEFNELENRRVNPRTGERLKNFWGYSTAAFFAPKASYASGGGAGRQVEEFKEMVKAFHRAGLEVILDVVFNHTAEMDAEGPVISFRGLDNTIYYALDPQTKDYLNISGCGNTFNCNHAVVQAFVLDCLRYWVTEMHVDGFRFDLATILGRDQKGELIRGPSLIHMIEQEPVLASTKIIAEPWDMQGTLVGGFPGRWAEWNPYYRDDVRRFVRGDRGMAPALATRIAGSSDLYQAGGRSPYNSINYVTCHDGFTLNDLVSYNRKHNEENGEENRDGSDENFSANSGVEGPTEDIKVQEMRLRRVKTFGTILMVSQGVPMILAGDEFGRTQQGNNNAYCQDNPVGWVDWRLAEGNSGLLRFFRKIIALRRRHPVFRRRRFLTGGDSNGDGYRDVSWQGSDADRPDWSEDARALAFLLDGSELDGGERDDDFFVILNADRKERRFALPQAPAGSRWFRIIDTSLPSPEEILDEDEAGSALLEPGYSVPSMAAAVFISRKE